MKQVYRLLLLTLYITLFSCRPDRPLQEPLITTLPDSGKARVMEARERLKKELFYGILTPVEVCSIFNRLNVPYNPDVVNPAANSRKYLSSSKIAVNTGIYCVDFGYLEMFDINGQMMTYLEAIRDMSTRLGIPERYLSETVNRLQPGNIEPDTVMAMLNKAFRNIEALLRDEGRASSSALVVLGGWVEALYIASQMVYDPSSPDPEIIERIAGQKYTLESLISFMKNYYEDPVAVYYLKKLKTLKHYFDSFDIFFKKGDLSIDTVRQILISSETEMTLTTETLNRIRDYVGMIRTEMVTP